MPFHPAIPRNCKNFKVLSSRVWVQKMSLLRKIVPELFDTPISRKSNVPTIAAAAGIIFSALLGRRVFRFVLKGVRFCV